MITKPYRELVEILNYFLPYSLVSVQSKGRDAALYCILQQRASLILIYALTFQISQPSANLTALSCKCQSPDLRAKYQSYALACQIPISRPLRATHQSLSRPLRAKYQSYALAHAPCVPNINQSHAHCVPNTSRCVVPDAPSTLYSHSFV